MKNKIIFLVSIIVFIVDIISKILVSNFMLEDQSIKIINNFLYFTYAKNTGIAFSFLEGNMIFIISMTLIIVVLLIKYVYNKKLDLKEKISYGLVLGGAIGNLFDRIVYGYVIDFIDVYIFGYDYPIFNVADSCVVVGIILILLLSFKSEGSEKDEVNSRKTRKNR